MAGDSGEPMVRLWRRRPRLHVPRLPWHIATVSWVWTALFAGSLGLTYYAAAVRAWIVVPGLGLAAVLLLVAAGVSVFGGRSLKYFFVAPLMVILGATLLAPILFMFYISVTNVTMLNFNREWHFVGLHNYGYLLFEDSLTLLAMVKTLEFVLISVSLEFVIGLGVAVALNREFPGKGLLTSLFLSALMIAPIVSGLLWKYMLNFDMGLINQVLDALGLPRQPWLTNEPLPFISRLPWIGPFLVTNLNANYAFLSAILVDVWHTTPFIFIVLVAGLRSLPLEPFEAAAVDGASRTQTFFLITLPLLRPVILVALVIRLIGAMKSFESIWALFGASTVTRVLNIHIYSVGMAESHYGEASALSVMLFIISILLALLYLKVFPGSGSQRKQ